MSAFGSLTPLHHAIQKRQWHLIVKFVENIELLNSKDIYGDTPLILATKWNYKAAIDLLLRKGCRIDEQGKNGYTALHRATEDNDILLVKNLIFKKANPNIQTGEEKFTALHIAASKGNAEIIKVIIDSSENIDTGLKCCLGQTALHIAVIKRHTDCVRILLEANAKLVDIEDESGETALIQAVLPQHVDEDDKDAQKNIVDLLLKYGSNIDIYSKKKLTPFMIVGKYGLSEILDMLKDKAKPGRLKELLNLRSAKTSKTAILLATERQHTGIVRKLIKYGADPRIPSIDGNTPLHIAAIKGYTDVVLEILRSDENKERRLEIDIKNNEGFTALHYASANGRDRIVEELIAFGSNVIEKCQDGSKTAIFLAAENNDSKTVEKLLENNANPNVCNEQGDWIIHIVAAKGYNDIIDLLSKSKTNLEVTNNEGQTALHCAIIGRQIKTVKKLLNLGFSVNSTDNYNKTPLMYALDKTSHDKNETKIVEIVNMLLDRKIDITKINKDDRNVLMIASENGLQEVVELLAPKFVEIDSLDTQDHSGSSALYLSVKQGHEGIVSTLLTKGANPFIKTKDIKFITPLHTAAAKGYANIIELLTAKNNSKEYLNSRNKLGQTALHIAAEYLRQKAVITLLQISCDVNAQDKYSNSILFAANYDNTPLHLAVGSKVSSENIAENDAQEAMNLIKMKIVKELINNGAKIDMKNHKNCDALMMAIKAGLHDFVKEYKIPVTELTRTSSHNKKSPLYVAAESGQEKCVISLLERKIDPFCWHEFDECPTPVHVAASNGHDAVLRQFLKIKDTEDVLNIENINKEKPLHLASKYLKKNTVELLLDSGSDPNSRDKFGRTPLYCCVTAKENSSNQQQLKIDITNMLLEKGANVHTEYDGYTILMEAAKSGCKDIAKNIISKVIDKVDPHGKTARCLAKQNNHKKVSEILLRSGAKDFVGCIKSKDRNLNEKKPHSIVKESFSEVVELFKNVDLVKWSNKYGQNLLHLAAYHLMIDEVSALLNLCLNPNLRDQFGKTPLFLSIINEPKKQQGKKKIVNKNVDQDKTTQRQKTKLVQLLLEEGADYDLEYDGYTILILAASMGLDEIVQIIINEVINKRGPNGKTALCLAVENNFMEVAQLLLNVGAEYNIRIETLDKYITPLHIAVTKRYSEMVELLLSKMTENEREMRDFQEKTPLMLAVENGDVKTAECLLKFKANIHMKHLDGLTPLSAAVKSGNLEMLTALNGENDPKKLFNKAIREKNETLIRHMLACKVNLQDEKYLMKAIHTKDMKFIRFVIDKICNIEINTEYLHVNNILNFTPLHLAVEYGLDELVTELLERGADINAKNSYKLAPTALHLAILNNHISILRILLQNKKLSYYDIEEGIYEMTNTILDDDTKNKTLSVLSAFKCENCHAR